MDRDEVWRHIHTERRALAVVLADLPANAWTAPTQCPAWNVLEVASHVIAHPQIRGRQMAGMVGRNLGRGYNAMIRREVKRWAHDQTPQSVLADFERYDGSTRTVPFTSELEALVDLLAHTQDILRPLGIDHPMPPEAAAAATERAIRIGRVVGWTAARRRRLEATDIAWSHGEGTIVRAPMQELFLFATGRPSAVVN